MNPHALKVMAEAGVDISKQHSKTLTEIGTVEFDHIVTVCGQADVQAAAQVALEAGNNPQIIFQHYRELLRPKDAKSWFLIMPGDDGKIVYLEVRKDGGKGSEEPAKAEAVVAVAAAAVS